MRLACTIRTVTLAALAWSSTPALAFDDAKYPDLAGLWRSIFVGGGNSQTPFDPTKTWGLGQQAPLTPEYQAVLEKSIADQARGGQGNWPSGAHCMPAGLPTSMNVYGEMEFVVLPEITHILLNHNTDIHRRVYTDGRDWPADVEPTYQGYSIGRWVDRDGTGKYDLLEIETRFFKGPRALDPSGLPTHADNQSIVRERIFLDTANRNLLHDEITLIDHAFTRPWTVLKTYRRSAGKFPIPTEQDCAGDSQIIQIGTETYYLGAERQLMPTRKDQPPPDLRYFKASGQ